MKKSLSLKYRYSFTVDRTAANTVDWIRLIVNLFMINKLSVLNLIITQTVLCLLGKNRAMIQFFIMLKILSTMAVDYSDNSTILQSFKQPSWTCSQVPFWFWKGSWTLICSEHNWEKCMTKVSMLQCRISDLEWIDVIISKALLASHICNNPRSYRTRYADMALLRI